MSWLDEYAARVVSDYPVPPRHTSLPAVLGHSYRSRSARWLVGFAVVLGVPSAIFLALVDIGAGEEWLRYSMVAFFIAFTILIAGAPAIGALRRRAALRSGIVVKGDVLSAHWSPPSLRPATIDAGDQGFAKGRRRVFHPAGTFEESFESDSRWARELTPGTSVRLLADPSIAKVRFDLGPSKGSDEHHLRRNLR